MPKPLTDRKILTTIYEHYYDQYAASVIALGLSLLTFFLKTVGGIGP